MTIVCGTDFSENAGAAARVAAAIASRLGVKLSLVHVHPEPRRAELDAEAARLRAEFGVDVDPHAETGDADEAVVALAGRLGARMVVVGSLGARKQYRWLVGSVAERVAQSCPTPVLVVREGASLEAWARGGPTLRVMICADDSPVSKAALAWAHGLAAIGSCDIAVVRIVWPAELGQHTGVGSPLPLDRLDPALEARLVEELRQWAGPAPEGAATSYVVKPGWGRVDGHVTQLATESKVDLVVVGAHQRAGIARLWQGSVSRGVLHDATMNVACVPTGS